MRGLVALIGLLLVVKFVENTSGTLIREQTGGSVSLSGPKSLGSLIQCSVEHNGINYDLYPKNNLPGATFAGSPRYCTFFIKPINLDHAGQWKIHSIWKPDEHSNEFPISTPNVKSFYTNYTVHVEEEDDKLLPTNFFSGEDGSYATVYFKDYFDNITKCYIIRDIYDNRTHYILSDNGNGTSAGMSIYGKCGVRIPISFEFRGGWVLVQESGEYKMRTSAITINPYPKIMSSEELNRTWNHGSTKMTMGLDSFKIYSYCEVERPDGEVFIFRNTKCEYSVERVNFEHAGVWKIRSLAKFSMNIVEQKVNVSVIDPEAIKTAVTATKDNNIHILCQTYVEEIEYCLFTTPNGTVINALEGIGNEKYMYYGIGYHAISDKDFAQCGITIIQPSNDDFGLWKCTTKDRKSREIMNAFVSTTNPAGKKIDHHYVSTKDVFVKRSDNFTITCTTTASLDYCWLQSPNGTNYSVTKNRGNLQNYLPYVGGGLSVGICGATIENADDMHSGNWRCRLGVTGGAEIESIVPVTVTDSYITPVQKSINIAYNEPKLVVNVIPSTDATIQICRWIRPNGNGFSAENSNQYLRSQSKTSCVLTLKDWSSADLGTWSCYARFNSGSDEEYYTTIQVTFESQNGSYTILNIFSICLFTIIIIGSAIFGYIIYKKRLFTKNSSMSYNEFDPSKSGAITMKENPNI